MECEENLPEYNGGSDLIEYIDPFGVFSREADYVKIAEGLASYYRITLCDSADAQFVGNYASILAQRSRMMTRFVEDFNKLDHFNFLAAYMQSNGVSYTDAPVKMRPLFTAAGASSAEVQAAVYALTDAEIVTYARSLAARFSTDTTIVVTAPSAAPGGTTIEGSEFDFPACRPSVAEEFKRKCDRRVTGFWSRNASSGGANGRYQVNKCGPKEYSLRNDASARSYAPLADGLAPTRPRAAKSGFAFACCILDAKYVGNPTYSPYQDKRRYRQNVRTALRSPFIPPFLRKGGLPGALAYYESVRAQEVVQLGAYIAAAVDPEIPYWRLVYICSNAASRDYFHDLIQALVVARAIARACESSARSTRENWKT